MSCFRQYLLLVYVLSISSLYAQAAKPFEKVADLRNQGKFDHALSYCDSLASKAPPDSLLLKANLYDLMGDIYYLDLMQDSLSGVYFGKALIIKEKSTLDFEKSLDYTLFRLGLVYYYQAQLDTALYFHRRALGLREKKKDINLMRSYKALGTLYEDKEDYVRAEEYYQLALLTLLEVDAKDYRRLANLENYRGILFYKQEKYEEAASVLKKAMDYYEQIEKENQASILMHMADCLTNLGNAYNMLNLPEKALDVQQRANFFYSETKKDVSSKIAWNLNNMAITYAALKKPKQAQETLEKALEAHKQHFKTSRHQAYAANHDNRADIAFDNKELAKAAKQYHLAIYNVLPLWNPKSEMEVPVIDKQTLILGTKSNLVEYLASQGAVRYQQYLFDNKFEYLEQSLLSFEAADALINLLRRDIRADASKLFWLEKTKSIYENAISTSLLMYEERKKPIYLEKAFGFAEKSKAVLLFEKLREESALAFSNLPAAISNKERQLRAQISKLELIVANEQRPENIQELQKIRLAHDAIVQQMEEEFPQYEGLKHADKPAPISKIQELLPPNTALVEFFWGENMVFIFYMDNTKLHYFKLLASDEEIYAFMDLVAAPLVNKEAVQSYSRSSFYLYKTYLAPIFDELKDMNRVLVVPDGPLGYLPFEALTSKEVEAPTLGSMPYLLRDYSFSYAYSASVLLYNWKKPNEGTNFLLIAPEQYPNVALPDLDLPDYFVKKIKSFYTLRQEVGKQATKSNFFQTVADYQVVHLYTHALATADGIPHINLRDSILNIKELYDLNLSADLVVLTACETNKGTLKKGEGIMSLSRAFSLAGVPSLVSSRWKLRKKAATDITLAFYERLAAGLTKDEALRQAKLDYMQKENPSPYFWASFVHIGDFSPLEFRSSGTSWKGWVLGLLGLVCGLGFWWFKR